MFLAQSETKIGLEFLSLIILVIAAVWIIFPFIVIGKFNRLIAQQREDVERTKVTQQLLKQICGHLDAMRGTGGPPPSPKAEEVANSEEV